MDTRDKGAFSYYYLGEKFIINGDYEAAESMFDVVLLMDSKTTIYTEKAYLGKATIRAKKNDFQGAIDIYSKMIEINSQCAGAYFYRGLTYICNLGQIETGKTNLYYALDILREQQDYLSIKDCLNILCEITVKIPDEQKIDLLHILEEYRKNNTDIIDKIRTLDEIKSLVDFTANKNLNAGNISDDQAADSNNTEKEENTIQDTSNKNCLSDTKNETAPEDKQNKSSEQFQFEAYYVADSFQKDNYKNMISLANKAGILISISNLCIVTPIIYLFTDTDGIVLVIFYLILCFITLTVSKNVGKNISKRFKCYTDRRILAIAVNSKGLLFNSYVNKCKNNILFEWDKVKNIAFYHKPNAAGLTISLYDETNTIPLVIRYKQSLIVSKKASEICWAIEYYSDKKFAFDGVIDN